MIFKCIYEIYLFRTFHKWGVFLSHSDMNINFSDLYFFDYNFLENWDLAHYNLAFSAQKRRLRSIGFCFSSIFEGNTYKTFSSSLSLKSLCQVTDIYSLFSTEYCEPNMIYTFSSLFNVKSLSHFVFDNCIIFSFDFSFGS